MRMSDYLSNLASKSLNLTAVIQPRPVSVFEPSPVARWPASGHCFGLGTVGGEEASGERVFDAPSRPPDTGQQRLGDLSVIPDWRSRQSIGQERPMPAPALPQSTEIRPEQPASQPGRAEAQPISSRTPGPISPPGPPRMDRPTFTPTAPSHETDGRPSRSVERQRRPERQPAPGAERPASTQASVPILGPIVAQLSGGRVPQQPEPDQATLTPTPASEEMGATPPRTTPEGESQRALKPLIQHIVTERISSPAEPPRTAHPLPELSPVRQTYPPIPGTIVARPETRSYIEAKPPAHFEMPARREPPPTIQVTIGRIEVRATPPAAPSPRTQRPKPPVMSLDEYLRKRAKGGGG